MRQPLDILSLVGGSMSVGILIYGSMVIHRVFLANLFPLGFNLFGSIWSLPLALVWTLHIFAGLIVVSSLLIIAWAWFHAHRDRFKVESGMPIAIALATPLIAHELMRIVFGVGVFDTFVETLFSAF